MNARILRTIILKDLTLYFRNRFFAPITIAAVILYAVIYLLMPSTVDEDLTLAVYAPTIPDAFIQYLGGDDINVAPMESDAALQEAVINSEYIAGIVLTGDVVNSIANGEATTVRVYFASDAPQEIINALRTVLKLAFNEMSYTLNGNPLRLEFREEIVGPDMTGQQLTVRNRLLPLLAVMLLVMEMMGLGNLIAEEITAGTLRALLITPLNIAGLFTGKAIVGILLAFVQASLLMAITGNLKWEPILVLTTLLLGALVVTGLAFLIASFSRGLLGVMAWSLLVIILMLIPSYGVVFPGVTTSWAQLIPSYYMFDTIHQVVNFGASWGAVGTNLIILLVMGMVFMGVGVFVMERKLR